MTTVSTDHRRGINSGAAIKVACVCATTANITLSGEQSIDGITTSGDRVFVKDQSDAITNGIYLSSASTWTREPDFDGTWDVTEGTIVSVSRGTANTRSLWQITNIGTITIGTTAITVSAALVVSDASGVSFTQTGTGAVASTVDAKLNESVSVLDFMTAAEIADVQAGTALVDVTAAIQAAIDTTPEELYLPSGTYKVTAQLDITNTIRIYGNATIDATGSFTGTYVFAFQGAGFTAISDLTGNESKGVTSVDLVTVSGLSNQDIFLITNTTDGSWSGHQADYRQGEYCQVDGIAATTVTLSNPLYDSYVTANVDLYRQDSITPTIEGLTINCGTSDPNYAIFFRYCRNARAINLNIDLNSDAAIYIRSCYNTTVHGVMAYNEGDGGANYGVLAINSQYVFVSDSFLTSRTHAMVSGGGGLGGEDMPVRGLNVNNCILRNDQTSTANALSVHGHTEYASISDCLIHGGIDIGGKNNSYSDCIITNMDDGVCALGVQILGGFQSFNGCSFISYADPQSGSRGVIDVGGNSNVITASTTEDTTFIFDGCYIEGAAFGASTKLINIRNRGGTNKVNVSIDNLTIQANTYAHVLWVDNLSGTPASDFIKVNGIHTNVSLTTTKSVDVRNAYDAGNVQIVTDTAALDMTHDTHHIVTTTSAIPTLIDGYDGEHKYIVMKTDVGDSVLTPSNLANGTTITFDDVGDSAHLFYTNDAWHFMGGTATLA